MVSKEGCARGSQGVHSRRSATVRHSTIFFLQQQLCTPVAGLSPFFLRQHACGEASPLLSSAAPWGCAIQKLWRLLCYSMLSYCTNCKAFTVCYFSHYKTGILYNLITIHPLLNFILVIVIACKPTFSFHGEIFEYFLLLQIEMCHLNSDTWSILVYNWGENSLRFLESSHVQQMKMFWLSKR